MTPRSAQARARRAAAPSRAAHSLAEPLEGRVLLATTQVPGFQDGVYTTGLTAPTSMEFAPDGRLFITQQTGQLRVGLPGNTSVLTTPFVTLPTSANGERGLLSVTLDPNFMSNGYLYVYYTANTPAAHNRVSRFTAVDADPDPAVYRPGNTAATGSELPILDLENLSSATNHNGGAIHFGPDGKLYVAVGENANPSNSQTLANRLGKMLRINPDGSIPADNPFYTQATGVNRAIWALGLRNPYTFAFEPGSGRMFINDVGQSAFEEVNDGVAGANYGWPNTEGYRTNQPLPTIGTYKDPLLAYGRSVGTTVTGGAFYRPPVQNFPQQYVGKYFFGDYGADWVRYIDPSTNRPPINNFAVGAFGPVDYEVGPDGALYYLSIDGRQVGRITWVGPRITTQPQSQAVDEGQPVTFDVVAAGPGTLTYRWRRNDVDIPGATGASYTLPSATVDDSGASFTVVVSNSSASVTSDPATLTVRPVIPTVVGQYVFYNDSRFDGRDPAATEADDAAIATDKKPLLWGQAASFENMTGYSRGINGVMIDVDNLPATPTLSAADFVFSVGRGEGKWAAAPAPQSVSVRPGAGASGSDRVTLTWPDGRIVNRWLKVSFKPSWLNLAPGIVDEFYFGNLRGEVGNAPPDATRQAVNVIDEVQTRAAMGTMVATITNLYDHNRDGRVNALDRAVAARNRGTSLALFTAPPPPPAGTAAVRRSADVLA
jgi:glucose/arabinose dehydrogenase